MTIYKGERYFENNEFPFYIDQYTIPKGAVIPSHTHDFIELTYVVSGRSAASISAHYQRSFATG